MENTSSARHLTLIKPIPSMVVVGGEPYMQNLTLFTVLFDLAAIFVAVSFMYIVITDSLPSLVQTVKSLLGITESQK
jgi:hypothetical protein